MIIATDFIAVTTTRDAINIKKQQRQTHAGKNGTFENRQSIHTQTQRNHERKKTLYLKSQAIAQTTNVFFVFVFVFAAMNE